MHHRTALTTSAQHLHDCRSCFHRSLHHTWIMSVALTCCSCITRATPVYRLHTLTPHPHYTPALCVSTPLHLLAHVSIFKLTNHTIHLVETKQHRQTACNSGQNTQTNKWSKSPLKPLKMAHNRSNTTAR